MAIFFAVALAIDGMFLSGHRFASVSPHPFWIIVLLMSAFYGLGEGLVAACLASLIFRVGNLPPQQIDQHVYDHAWTVLREPLLWVLTAAVLGEIRRQQRRATEMLTADLAATRARLDELGEAYRRLDAVRDRLEARVASQSTTAVQLYKAVQAADRLDAQEVLTTIAEVVRATLDPEAFSLFLLQGDTLECTLREGWPEEAPWPSRYGAGDPIFDTIVAGRRALCVVHPGDEAVLGGDGLLAGPLIDMRSGELAGMLKIERMRFLDFNLGNLQAFRALCEWIATAYQNARRYEQAQADRVLDQLTQLHSATFLERQRAYLTAMAQRFGFDLTMLVARVEDVERLNTDERVETAAAISRAVRSHLRRTDMAFDYRRDLGEVAVLMPGTSLANAHLVARKLERAIGAQLARPPRLAMRTHALYLAASGPTAAAAPGVTGPGAPDMPRDQMDEVA